MYGYQNSNFATVFFLVVIFIGMGLLIYHTSEITIEKNELETELASTQESIAGTLNENKALKAENDRLATEVKALKESVNALNSEWTSAEDEVNRLNAELQNRNATIAALQATIKNQAGQIDGLIVENKRLIQNNLGIGGGEGTGGNNILQSTPLPTDIETWMKLAAMAMIIAILVLTIVAAHLIMERRKLAAAKARSTRTINSRFIER